MVNYIKSNDTQFKLHYELGKIHWWLRTTNELFFKTIRHYLPWGNSILDAGCGVGNLLFKIDNEYVTFGVDLSESALKFCKNNVLKSKLICGNTERLPFCKDIFNAVLSLDVLYHLNVKDDENALKEIYRVLLPGGYLFLHLPAYNFMYSSHDKIAHSVRRYTINQVKELLTRSDFEIIRLTYRVCFLFPFAFFKRKILRSDETSDLKSVPRWLNFLLEKIMYFENILVLRYNLPFGLSVFSVARKKGQRL
ncbi:MAG: class I SAM-dependent methyltransferase [Candidatus Hydrogenedentota bacterium]